MLRNLIKAMLAKSVLTKIWINIAEIERVFHALQSKIAVISGNPNSLDKDNTRSSAAIWARLLLDSQVRSSW